MLEGVETNALLDTESEVYCKDYSFLEKHWPNIIIQDLGDMMNLVMADDKISPLWDLWR